VPRHDRLALAQCDRLDARRPPGAGRELHLPPQGAERDIDLGCGAAVAGADDRRPGIPRVAEVEAAAVGRRRHRHRDEAGAALLHREDVGQVGGDFDADLGRLRLGRAVLDDDVEAQPATDPQRPAHQQRPICRPADEPGAERLVDARRQGLDRRPVDANGETRADAGVGDVGALDATGPIDDVAAGIADGEARPLHERDGPHRHAGALVAEDPRRGHATKALRVAMRS
jgi:hypothetical protein